MRTGHTPPLPTPPRESAYWAFSPAVARWTLFSLGFGLLPVLFGQLLPASIGRGQPLFAYLSEGHLLISAAVLAGTAVGELLGRTGTYRETWHVVLGWAGAITGVLASGWYGALQLASALQSEGATTMALDADLIGWGSVMMLFISAVVGGNAVRFAEVSTQS